MARYNEILVGRFNRMLQKHFGMKGEPPAPQLASEISPNLNMADWWSRDILALHGFIPFGNILTIAAVAAQDSAVQLRNPANSGIVAVIDKLVLRAGVAATTITLGINASAANLTTLAPTVRSLDGRQSNTGSSCILSGQNNVFGGGLPTAFADPEALLAGQDYDFILNEHQSLPLLPGDALVARSDQVNVTLAVTLLWRERVLEENELKL